MAFGTQEVWNRFSTHKPREGRTDAVDTVALHDQVREMFIAFAQRLDNLLPDGREKSVTFTELETSSMWAHKSIATHDHE